jgi:putative glutamate/gamma-aminobutyrate antiporter
VAAELATSWPKEGGVYVWVRVAFGARWGFAAVWLQWLSGVIWFPTALSFAAATLAFGVGDDDLANNKLFVVTVVLIFFWSATLGNFRGMKASGWISSVGVTIGTLLPGALIIVLGISWVIFGRESQVTFDTGDLFPDITTAGNLTFLIAVLFSYAGMELSSSHATDVENPGRNYPRAILLATVLIFSVYTLAALAIAIVIPRQEISLVAGVMEAFEAFLKAYDIGWLVWLIALLLVAGAIGQVNALILAPARGLLVASEDGEIPPYFRRENQAGIPTSILIVQALIVTGLSVVFVLMPSVNSSYWILTALTAQVYLVMYILMFAAAIKLRYAQPEIARPYRIPGGTPGIWIVAGAGIFAATVATLVGFYPPSQVSTGNEAFFIGFLVVGMVLTVAAPLVIHRFRKPQWASVEAPGAQPEPAFAAEGE